MRRRDAGLALGVRLIPYPPRSSLTRKLVSDFGGSTGECVVHLGYAFRQIGIIVGIVHHLHHQHGGHRKQEDPFDG